MATTKTSNLSKGQRRKYWNQRYNLFSKYDQGIQMDDEGWFSVTPEEIAINHAERCTEHQVVIDAFCGVGGNAIQFARKGCHVIAIDIDPAKVAMAMNNAKVYGVEEYIDFIVGDFFVLAPSLKGDVVFLSPPWGGPSYKDIQIFTLELLKPADGYTLFKVAQAITSNIMMFLPRNINQEQVQELSGLSSPPLQLEVESNYVRNHHKGVTLYFRSQLAASLRFSSDSSGGTMDISKVPERGVEMMNPRPPVKGLFCNIVRRPIGIPMDPANHHLPISAQHDFSLLNFHYIGVTRIGNLQDYYRLKKHLEKKQPTFRSER